MFLQFAAAALTYFASFLGHPTHALITPLPQKTKLITHSQKKVAVPQLVSGLTIISTPSPEPSPTPTIEVQGPPAASESAVILPTTTPTATPTTTPTPSPTIPITPAPTAIPTPTNTPTPTPSPIVVAAVSTPADLDTLFSKYANQYHADKNLMEKIAKCESSFNNNAEYLGYVGMFQFASDSWTTVRNRMSADPNPDLRKNPEEAIKTAAYMIGNGGSSAWPSCEK